MCVCVCIYIYIYIYRKSTDSHAKKRVNLKQKIDSRSSHQGIMFTF